MSQQDSLKQSKINIDSDEKRVKRHTIIFMITLEN
jgi:hypothetical protein